jgi:hypothetical protein
MPEPSEASAPVAHLPAPPSELRAWLLAGAAGVLGLAVLIAVLTGVIGRSSPATPPPPVLIVAPTPVAGPSAAASALAALTRQGSSARAGAEAQRRAGAVVTWPSTRQQQLDARRFVAATRAHIARRWLEGFYPIYEAAQSTFGVNWLLLASVHMQESAFSTAPSTYHGLNFAHCCGGPMQFNVTNGSVTTWDLVANSYIYGRRPASYNHPTATHPSIYDDFDSIMAGAHLLSADGAGYALDGSAWAAAYDYYGHDATGVVYADQVLARAIGWSQRGFCINCGVDTAMVDAVHAAYGAPVLATLTRPAAAPAPAPTARARGGARTGRR